MHVLRAIDDLGSAHLPQERECDAAAVADEMHHAQPKSPHPPQQERGRTVLRRIDDRRTTPHLMDAPIEPFQDGGVGAKIALIPRPQPRHQHEENVAIAIHAPLQGHDLLDPDLVPSTEPDPTHFRPERTVEEGCTATTQLVPAQSADPQMDDFAR